VGTVKRVEAVERQVAGRGSNPADWSPLARWFVAYLDQTLTVGEVVSLAEAVDDRPGADPVEADRVWGLVWGRAHGRDLENLRGLFGQRGPWTQLLGNG